MLIELTYVWGWEGGDMYAGGQGQNKKLSSVRNMKKMESYSAKTDAALGRNNQLVGQTD